ncbi:MAG: FAD-dependent oxidoreductase [Dehalococcoidia bacterium]|nr:FAD-dependent oxidoreductase [Dehalococcoidia bacterium]
MDDQGRRLLVIGGGAAGMSAAMAARRLQTNREIVVLERGSHVSFVLCGLPYFVSGIVKNLDSLIVYTPEYFRAERNIDVRTGHEVKRIDAQSATVEFVDVATREKGVISYDKLVITAGAQPIVPSIRGLALPGVFALRSLEGGAAIKDFLARRPVRRAAIIGAGYIGLEMAESLKTAGARVTMIEASDSVLPGSEPEIAALIEEEVRRQGVELLKQQLALSIESNAAATVDRVTTDSGDVEADMVLIAAGARPDTAIARETGIGVGETGGIVTDEMMRTNIPDIYAAGDCAEARHLLTGRPIFLPLGTTANKQGRVAGENACGGHAVFPGILGSLAFRLFDIEVARTGLSRPGAGGGLRANQRRRPLPFALAVLPRRPDAHRQAGRRQAQRPAPRRPDGRQWHGGEAHRRRRRGAAREDGGVRPRAPRPGLRAPSWDGMGGHSARRPGATAASGCRRLGASATPGIPAHQTTTFRGKLAV